MRKFFVVVILMLTEITIAVSASKSAKDFDTMEWKTGDRIACVLNEFLGGKIGKFKHWMLAVDEQRVIHIAAIKKSKKVRIRIQNREEVSEKMFNRNKCYNLGPGIMGTNAVERAMSWPLNTPYSYNLLTCNCSHWVNLWADGYTRSIDKSCPHFEKVDSTKSNRVDEYVNRNESIVIGAPTEETR